MDSETIKNKMQAKEERRLTKAGLVSVHPNKLGKVGAKPVEEIKRQYWMYLLPSEVALKGGWKHVLKQLHDAFESIENK